MLRLVLGDVATSARVWVGAAVVSAGAAAAALLAAALLAAAGDVGGNAGLALYAISGSVIAFTGIAGVVTLTSVGGLTVALQRRSHALWLLVGVRPGAVTAVVLGQLVIVAVAGALCGSLLAAPVLPWATDGAFADSPGLTDVRLRFEPAAVPWVVAGVAGLVLFSGLRPARRAGRVSGVELLQDADPPLLRMGPWRWLAAAVGAALTVAIGSSLRGRSLDDVETPLSLLAPVVSTVLVAVGPLFFAGLLRVWTGRLPAGPGGAWFLARRTAEASVRTSTAAVNPLVVTMALTGGVWAAHAAVADAVADRTGVPAAGLPAQGLLLLLGGPLLVALLGSAATVFMSGRARERNAALVQAAGGTGAVVLAAAAGEAVVLVVTAVLLAGGSVLVTAGAAAWAVETAALTDALAGGLPALLVTAAGGLVLVGAATVVPTALALRQEPVRTLASE